MFRENLEAPINPEVFNTTEKSQLDFKAAYMINGLN